MVRTWRASRIALSKGRIFDETAPLLARGGHRRRRGSGDLAQADPRHQPPRRAAHHRARDRRADLRAVRRGRPRRRRQGRAGRARRRRAVPAARPRHRRVPHDGRGARRLRLRAARCARARACASRPSTCSTAREHFAAKGVHVDLIKLYGSMELAPLRRPRRRDRRPGLHRQHAARERAGRGRGDHADLGAPDRQPGGAQAEARDAAAADRRVRQAVPSSDEHAPSFDARDRSFDAQARRASRASRPRRTRRSRRRCAGSSPTCASAATRRCSSTRSSSTAWTPRRRELELARRACVDAHRRRAQRDALARRAPSASAAIHERQLPKSWSFTDADGTALGQRVTPLDRVGLYVPGGKAAYPSSVLMNAMPAKVAGVREIVMWCRRPTASAIRWCSPPRALAGVDRVLAIGGAQAVAALAYGTETVPARRQDRRPGQRLRRRGEAPRVRRRSASTWSPARPRSW